MFRRSFITPGVVWLKRNQINGDYARRLQPQVYVYKREQGTVAIEDSYVKKFMKAVGWMDQSRTVSKTVDHLITIAFNCSLIMLERLKLTGYFLYESVPDKVAYQEWFEKLDLPDTFVSWFTITELHVWMLMVRYMAEDITTSPNGNQQYVKGDGHFVRNCIIEALWADVGNKIKLLEGANPAIARKQVSELSEQFQAALVAYDEALNDDKILAAAIWRRFYTLSEDAKAENIERIVHFVRHQISLLDQIPSEDLKFKPTIAWLSILDH